MPGIADVIEPNLPPTRWRTGKVTSVNPFTVSLDGTSGRYMPSLVGGLAVNDRVLVLTDSRGHSVVVGKPAAYNKSTTQV